MSKTYFPTVSFLPLLILLLLPFRLFSQSSIDTSIHWKTVTEIQKLMKTVPRPILIYLYQPTEDSSRMMLESTLSSKEIYTYLNTRFYTIKINVATEEPVLWFDNKIYTKKAKGIQNDLISQLLGPDASYPSLLFYNSETAGFVFKGLKSRYEMRCLLVYFAEEIEKTTPFDLWSKAFKETYPSDKAPKELKSPIHWISLKQAMALHKKSPKGIFINWYSRINVGSNVMLYNAFENSKVATYLNENFYCVRMDAQTRDTLFWDKPFYNDRMKGTYNQLALMQLNEKMKFPALLFFDKERSLIASQQSYLGSLTMLALANYAGSGSYKTMTLKEYIRNFKEEL